MKGLIETGWHCSVCGEWNETTVDPEGGFLQEYIEDCFVCCHPNKLVVTIQEVEGELDAFILSEYEE
ncbi:MAG: CPXCG motif-containing cysteine-rich protein [Chloroherpetonaceae bacterium]|nr:CPXCG motif-containing cysteine-rich protein [Chloroherpetonaceae bacterium]